MLVVASDFPTLPEGPSNDVTLLQWLLSGQTPPAAWGLYVDPRDPATLHELSLSTELPFSVLTPQSCNWQPKQFILPESWHWISLAVGSVRREIQWHTYSDSRYDGCHDLAGEHSSLQGLRLTDSFSASQETLDQLICNWVHPHEPAFVSGFGWLLLESQDLLSVLLGAIETLPRLSLLAWRLPSLPLRQGDDSLERLLSRISPDGSFITRDEWRCFTQDGLQELIVAIHDSRDEILLNPAVSRLALRSAGSTQPHDPSILHSALRSCIGADWVSLAGVGDSLRKENAFLASSFASFLNSLQRLASLRFGESDPIPFTQNDAFSITADRYLEVAFSSLSRIAELSMLEETSSALAAAQRFARLLLAAASLAGFPICDEESKHLLMLSAALPERLATQIQLRQLAVDGRLPGRTVFVIGMHRSGTSALAGLLHHAGFAMPQSDLIEANHGNLKGHWESRAVYAINNQLLARLGSTWHGLAEFPHDWIDGSPARRWRRDLLDFFKHTLLPDPPPILKDPRFSLLGSAMQPWLVSGSFDPVFLLSVRHPSEVAESLWRRDQISALQSTRLWISYTLAACKLCQERAHRVVVYGDLIGETQTVLLDIIRLIEPSSEPHLDVQSSIGFVESDLRHCIAEDLMPGYTSALRDYPVELRLALHLHDLLASSSTIIPAVAYQIDELAIEWNAYRAFFTDERSVLNRSSPS